MHKSERAVRARWRSPPTQPLRQGRPARKQAERKGLPYQTYIKSLLHETLVERERQSRSRNSSR